MLTQTALVAGHICLDIIPQFQAAAGDFDFASQFAPGGLLRMGPAILSTGGPVSNTGLALYKLGVPTILAARIGADLFGQSVRSIVACHHPSLTEGLATLPDAITSYSVIISPPGVDRLFLHCPGANDQFGQADVPDSLMQRAALLHFGYPPVMRRMIANQGAELGQLFQRAKANGLTTSLDMCTPDPVEGRKVDWEGILSFVLPYVDIFTPSLEELLFMLDWEAYKAIQDEAGMAAYVDMAGGKLHAISERLLGMGAQVILLKLGRYGAYLRTGKLKRERLGRAAPPDLDAWQQVERREACFKVQVVGATGSGDATIAGFLSGWLRGQSPQEALTSAVAVGACNVESADALSGIPDWNTVQERVAKGWEKLGALL
jgi:sugar/nucleoside kinase (ribokinase family)